MPWYKEFFEKWYLELWLGGERFKPAYLKREVVFIKRVLNLPKGAKILDLCCGHGRHVLPLAKAGYEMTGLDLSQRALNLLKAETKRQKLNVRVVRSDMRKIPFRNEFDAVINMFTAFGYLENDKEDLKVLKSVVKALKPGGKFLIDMSNRDSILANYQPKSWKKEGKLILLEERTYNPKKSRNITKTEVIDEKGESHFFHMSLRMYSVKELKAQLEKAGLKVVKFWEDIEKHKKQEKIPKRIMLLAVKK